MDPRKRCQCNLRLLDAAAGDLVSGDRADDLIQNEREPTVGCVVLGKVAVRQRTADPCCEAAIELDLTQVRAKPDARGAADRVVRCQLDDDRLGVRLGDAEADAVALAHLAGADPLCLE